MIRLLGAVEVIDADGRATSVAGSRPALLLALLVEGAPAAVPASRLAEALWDDEPPVDPAGALQSQIARLRRRLGAAAVIENVAGGYRLRGAEIDVQLFERLLRNAGGLDAAAALERLDAALALWGGAPFGEHGDHPRLRATAVRLEESRVRAIEARAAALLELGLVDEAAATAAALVSAQPLREAPVALLARCHSASGRQVEALDVLRAYTRALGDEVGLSPSAAIEELERSILRNELPAADRAVSGRGAARRSPRVVGELPEFPTSFIGREDDVRHLLLLLASHRLVTVVGTGGVGKTRLAIETARVLAADAFPDGRWFVDLAAVRSPEGVAAAVAGALGLEREGGSDAPEGLVDALSARRALLLLDNCEHLLGAVVDVVDAIVSGTRWTAVLATSRERLGMGGEHCHVVRPLPTPEGDRCAGPAAQLFLDRSEASRPGLALTERDEAAVCELCRRVDGLPLGIELTAMLMTSRSPSEILEDLSTRSAQPHRRGGEERHRSMDAVLAWSHDRLDDADRLLLEQLSVFAGGFTRDGAASVGRLSAGDTASRLATLVERSLVNLESSGVPSRYRLLEPVREFAHDRLEERGCGAATHDRHAAWVTDLVRDAAAGLEGADEVVTSQRLSAELGNIRAAIRHHREAGNFSANVRLLAPLYWYMWSGAHSEIGTWAEDAVSVGHDADDVVADVLAVAANGAFQRGELEVAEALARRGVDACGGDTVRARRALDVLADLHVLRGDNAPAVVLYLDALEGARRAGDAKQVVVGTCNLALAHAYAGDVGTAVAHADEGRDLARVSGNPSNVAYATYVRGEVVLEVEPAEALPLLDAAVSAAEAAGNRFVTGISLMSAVSVAARARDPHAALRRYGALIEHWQRIGNWTQQWTTLRTLVETLVRVERDEPAAILLGAMRATRHAAPLIGADADRVAAAEKQLRARLGDARLEGLLGRGAALGDAGVLELARSVVSG